MRRDSLLDLLTVRAFEADDILLSEYEGGFAGMLYFALNELVTVGSTELSAERSGEFSSEDV